MHATRTRAPAPPKDTSTGGRLRARDLTLPLAVGLWAYGLSIANVTRLGPYGLPAALPIAFFLGLATLICSAAIELIRARVSQVRLAAHAVALVFMLYGTAPLVYREGRYAWLYKTLGVVQYVNAHGKLSARIDIYQNWPGFFAVVAWFDKAAGLASPVSYAKWAQLVFELAAIPLLYLIYEALGLPPRHRWLAILLYSVTNWVAQDYFSPQALGTVLSLGIMAAALRWFFVPRRPPRRQTSRRREYGGYDPYSAPGPTGQRAGHEPALAVFESPEQRRRHPPANTPNPRLQLVPLLLIAGLYFVLVLTHELSPYIIAVQLGALAAFGLLRPRWLPLLLVGIAAAYLIPRFSFVNRQYGLMASIGHFLTNFAGPSALAQLPVPPQQIFVQRCADALSLGIWVLALMGAWLNRQARGRALAALLLAFSPLAVVFLQAYGNEGILRAYLFSLPWSAALAAVAVMRPAVVVASHRERRNGTVLDRQPKRHYLPTALRSALVIATALALFLPAFYGDDAIYTMTPAEVSTISRFFNSAPPGPIMLPIDNAPVSDTANYDRLPLVRIFGSYSLLGKRAATSDIANQLAATAELYDPVGPLGAKVYLVITASMIAYNEAMPQTPAGSLAVLQTSLSKSRYWTLKASEPGVRIYALTSPPASNVLPLPPSSAPWIAQVP